MQKPTEYDWKDSNMALFGSDTEKQVKKESAESESAWAGAGERPGTKVWRINKFKVEHWDEDQYGEFFNGDSYIVLHTYKQEEELKYDVHFWIGKYSTQDEYGTAAYKTVELDTLLDDKPVQHREVQGHESALFKTYFPTLTLLKGGADTGFRRVLPEQYTPRLFHVKKTGRNITCTQVSMKRGNLTSDDVFIIDAGDRIYQYNGAKSSHDERFKAAQEAAKMKAHRGKATVEALDEEDTGSDHPALQLLPEGKSREKSAVQGEHKQFKVSDADGSLDMDEVDYGSGLASDDVNVVNTGEHVYVWVGKDAAVDERKNGLTYAHNYLSKTETPYLPISVVAEGNEPADFKTACATQIAAMGA